ncbi:hypothetical protein MNBD_IGNAVI01-3125 [hydrothermal vent metagenome]|uniref:Uncharacterized protein n=1 Tax=hydrothermal vent metagenome TaxID=652676 RepID=A0A3B1CSG5_9ZZZZ
MKLLFIFTILLFSNISCTATNMKIILKTDKEKIIIPDKDVSEELLVLLKELVTNTDDMLKVYLSPERILNIKQKEQYIEFIFDSKIVVSSNNFGDYKINKILIPLSGDFAPSKDSPNTTVILGDESYISGPLRNSDGYQFIKRILTLLQN